MRYRLNLRQAKNKNEVRIALRGLIDLSGVPPDIVHEQEAVGGATRALYGASQELVGVGAAHLAARVGPVMGSLLGIDAVVAGTQAGILLGAGATAGASLTAAGLLALSDRYGLPYSERCQY